MATQTNEAQNTTEKPQSRLPLIVAVSLVVVVGGAVAALAYWGVSRNEVAIDKASVEAPTVVLSPTAAGTLNAVYVNVGDTIPANTVVAEVGTQLLKSGSAGGVVVDTNKNIGAQIAPGTAVVTLIDPSQLRIVGQVDENKGLADIAVGDRALFTVDAFGGQKFQGVVDEVSPTSHASGVVFNISDQRQTQTFDVKIAFDESAYPQLKNGMSARIWIYKQ
ncbi:MAG TPA: efflux RND transporter periplasmic adaptor subunit [Candidatus Paceibacterota bacterium]|nr:efflux RND transporter periplasmic adaptor subunit [Candidatus Paceibacterota bacterium]